jgi:Rrf2 family protein
MRLGKAAAYGVYATLHIAQSDKDGPIQGRIIAKSCGIPVEYLLKILQQLVRAQVLLSERGRGGGFLLRRTPAQTSLLDIVEAIEGPITSELDVKKQVIISDKARSKIEGVCEDIANHTRAKLRKTTIKQLMG